MKRTGLIVATAAMTVAGMLAQTPAQEALTRGKRAWDRRLSKTAIAALEIAVKEPSTAAEAHELLGRIYTFKGWQQDNVMPGWHDEPAYRERAIAELRASLASNPNRASAKEAIKTAEEFAAAPKVDPAPPRPEIRAPPHKAAADPHPSPPTPLLLTPTP